MVPNESGFWWYRERRTKKLKIGEIVLRPTKDFLELRCTNGASVYEENFDQVEWLGKAEEPK